MLRIGLYPPLVPSLFHLPPMIVVGPGNRNFETQAGRQRRLFIVVQGGTRSGRLGSLCEVRMRPGILRVVRNRKVGRRDGGLGNDAAGTVAATGGA